DEEGGLRRRQIRIILVVSRNRNEDDVVARLTEEIAERLHQADDAIRVAVNLNLFVERVFVRKERVRHVNSENTDVGTRFHIAVTNPATAINVLRMDELIIRCRAD